MPDMSGSSASHRAKTPDTAAMRARNTRRMLGATGAKPRSDEISTRSEDRSTGRRTASASPAWPSSGLAMGSRLSALAMALSSKAVSATSRPIGPCTDSTDQPWWRRSEATSPGLGRKPTTPDQAAGLRSDPPVSEPVHRGSIEVARATPEPPEKPAQDSAGPKALPVAPYTSLIVLPPVPNSGVLVLARTIAPACFSAATTRSSRSGTWSRNIGEP